MQSLVPCRFVALTIAMVVLVVSMSTSDWGGDAFDPFANAQKADTSTLTGIATPKTKALREGTLVPPTVGRIVVLGRRWAFVPHGEQQDDEDLVIRSPADSTRQQDRNRLSGNQLRSGRMIRRDLRSDARSPVATRRLGRDRLVGDRRATVNNELRGEREHQYPSLSIAMNELRDKSETGMTRVLIAENLMLQRIVAAIRADAADDHWLISGELTEYFNENRLIIRVAQRASSK